MKKRIILNLLMLVCFISFNKSVLAANTHAQSSDSGYETIKSNYDANNSSSIDSTKSTENNIVTLYGKSTCSGSSCTSITYQGGKTSSDEVLKAKVNCTNGEKYINVVEMFDKDKVSYGSGNLGNFEGEVYWSEDYTITCTNTNTTQSLALSSSSSTNSTVSSGTTIASNYSSSSTTDQSNTGITTYYIVLGIIALIAYLFMVIVKKFNLFKSI